MSWEGILKEEDIEKLISEVKQITLNVRKHPERPSKENLIDALGWYLTDLLNQR
tara:strand:- start:307 stop:468 length:162 start_codon:yes stop_codon:yes gene_type:complete